MPSPQEPEFYRNGELSEIMDKKRRRQRHGVLPRPDPRLGRAGSRLLGQVLEGVWWRGERTQHRRRAARCQPCVGLVREAFALKSLSRACFVQGSCGQLASWASLRRSAVARRTYTAPSACMSLSTLRWV